MEFKPINRSCSVKELKDAFKWSHYKWTIRIKQLAEQIVLFRNQRDVTAAQANIIFARHGRPASIKD